MLDEIMHYQDLIIWILSQLVAGAAIYGGIRADIRNLHKRDDQIYDYVKSAHDRIDRGYQPVPVRHAVSPDGASK